MFEKDIGSGQEDHGPVDQRDSQMQANLDGMNLAQLEEDQRQKLFRQKQLEQKKQQLLQEVEA